MKSMQREKRFSQEENEALQFAREALHVESEAVRRLADRIGEAFAQALFLLETCHGKVITTGVGKSGIIARKLAATLTSIGQPAVFLHPTEALHGDLGLVTNKDVVIAFSNSGESEELLTLLPLLRARDIPLIAITGNLHSTLARHAHAALDASVEREICPLNLAPTTSVLAALALSDALAMALQRRRHLSPEEYARNHPGGRLGRRLTLRVQDLLPPDGSALPHVAPGASFQEVVCELTAGHMGAVCVLDDNNHLLGLIAESDFRQAFLKHQQESFNLKAADMMNPNPILTLAPDQLAYEALQKMTQRPRPISVAPVLTAEGVCLGLLRVNDLVKAGL